MKGVSILLIALHNLLHWETLPFVKENESTFFKERPFEFLENLYSFSLSLPYDCLSYAGFYGVPVFVFLSGYGFVYKWEKSAKQMNSAIYVWDNYRKLFFLLIPLYLIYVIQSALLKGEFHWEKILLQITFLNNFVFNLNRPVPGVYWYFGFTLQLYILYIIYYKIRTFNFVLVTTFLCICILIVVNPQFWNSQEILIYVRHNSIGWLYCFTFGILWARKGNGFLVG